MSSGGNKVPKETSSTQTTIPKFAEPYAMEMLGRNQALNQTGFTPYGGQRNATFDPMQNQAFNSIGSMTTSPQTSLATGIASLVGGTAAGLSYDPSSFTNYQMGPVSRVGTQNWIDPGVASSYMSPYMQNVVQMQQRDANRQADIAGTKRGFQTATSGAYGGSRASLGDFEANRNLALQQGDIQTKGLQDAYTYGGNQFNQDQSRWLQSGIANQNADLTTGINNLNANLDVQRMGEESKQFGAKYGLDTLRSQLDSARLLKDLGTDQYNQTMGINQAQLDAGGQRQALDQRNLDVQYQEFLDKLNFPYKQMGFTSDLLHGLPTDQTRTLYGYPNTAAQGVGTLGGLASLYLGGKG